MLYQPCNLFVGHKPGTSDFPDLGGALVLFRSKNVRDSFNGVITELKNPRAELQIVRKKPRCDVVIRIPDVDKGKITNLSNLIGAMIE